MKKVKFPERQLWNSIVSDLVKPTIQDQKAIKEMDKTIALGRELSDYLLSFL
ncbi:MAG: hypothetical protein ABJA66_03675 [Actinomycetota bacterium]